MTHPEIEAEHRAQVMLPRMAARFGTQLPVPEANIERQLDIGAWCVADGRPQDIEMRILGSKYPEVEELRRRSKTLFEYTKTELITHHSHYFAEYYLITIASKE